MWQIAGIIVGLALIFGPLVWGWLKQHPGLLTDGGVRLLIILAWLRVVTPSVLQLLTVGRTPPGRPELPMAAIGAAAGRALGVLFLAVALVQLVTSVTRRPARHIGWLAAALAPWAALQVSHLLVGGTPDVWAVAYPVAAVAIWLRPPSVRVLATIGAVTAATAAASLLLVVTRPDLALYAGGQGVKTMYESGLLAGIYPHANMLGMAMALGIPFIFLIERPKLRMCSLVLSIGVLLATASRSSLAAAAGAVLLYLLVRKKPQRAQQRTALPLLGAAGVMAYLPLSTDDPTAYTDRGRIWMDSLTVWQDRPWTGWGPNPFTDLSRLFLSVRGQHSHAHNLLVMTLLTGGLVMVAAMAVMLFLTWRRAVYLSREGYAQPLIFLTVAIVVSWLEASLPLNNLSGYALWLPLLVVLLGRLSAEADDGGQDDASGQLPPVPGQAAATRTWSGRPAALRLGPGPAGIGTGHSSATVPGCSAPNVDTGEAKPTASRGSSGCSASSLGPQCAGSLPTGRAGGRKTAAAPTRSTGHRGVPNREAGTAAATAV